MNRVLIIRSNPVNPDSRVEKIAVSLVKQNYDVEILAWDRSIKHQPQTDVLKLSNFELKITRFGIKATYGGGFIKNLIPLFLFQVSLYRWLSRNQSKYDVFHACDFDTAFITKIICKKYRKKMIYDIFDYYVDSFSVPLIMKGIVEKMDVNTINSADATIICTEKRLEQICRSKPKILTIVHNSPPDFGLPEIKKPLAKKDCKTRIKIVYIGILGKGRLILELIDAISRRDDLEIHIGGYGPLVNDIILAEDKFPNIHFYGTTKYSETLEIEMQCDVMTAIYDPSIRNHRFAAPNKFYEALMLGKPIVVCKDTGIDEIVQKHDLGEVALFAIDSVMNAIDSLIKKKESWEKIKGNSRELYINDFSWSIMEKRLYTTYQSVLTSKKDVI